MADKEFLERMLSMLPEEFQDVYDDTIPKAKEMRKKMGDKVNTFSRLYMWMVWDYIQRVTENMSLQNYDLYDNQLF